MSDAPLPGPLEDFLARPPGDPAPEALRRDLLRRTSAAVRRRRRVRRVLAASLAAAVVLAALALWHFAPGRDRSVPVPRDEPRVQKRPEKPAVGAPRPAPTPPGPPAPAVAAEKPAPAVALEWQAFDAPRAQKAALYLKAGDRYFEDDQDLESALRCYGQAVQTAQAAELEVGPDDNWLVTALKIDQIERRKER